MLVSVDNREFRLTHSQIVSRNMTNLTPAQLEQFESTFRYFDRDETNTLEIAEMTGALASLGIIYPVRKPYQDLYIFIDFYDRKRTCTLYMISSCRVTEQSPTKHSSISWYDSPF